MAIGFWPGWLTAHSQEPDNPGFSITRLPDFAITQSVRSPGSPDQLEAADGTDALKVAGEYQGAVHLVLADLLMPGMRGDSVVGAIRGYRPDVKALFISGYASDDLDTRGVAILHKPFEFPDLARRIRWLSDSDLASTLKGG